MGPRKQPLNEADNSQPSNTKKTKNIPTEGILRQFNWSKEKISELLTEAEKPANVVILFGKQKNEVHSCVNFHISSQTNFLFRRFTVMIK
jgi:hypothetical protein